MENVLAPVWRTTPVSTEALTVRLIVSSALFPTTLFFSPLGSPKNFRGPTAI
jgi:hypothetical protein